MIKDFTKTLAYQRIKEARAYGKPYALAYFSDTGVLITEENIERLVETDFLRYKEKLEKAIELAPTLSTMREQLFSRIDKQIRQRMNQTYLRIHTDFTTAADVDEMIKEIQSQPDFAGWAMQ